MNLFNESNPENERRSKRARTIAEEIIQSIPIQLHERALDFGCGAGLLSFNLKDKFEHITLVDISSDVIDTLTIEIQNSRAANMTAVQGNINDTIKLQNGKFDVIYTSLALHHIADIEATIKNLYGLLTDAGHLCIAELVEDDGRFHKHEKDFHGHNGFNQEKLKALLEDLGFKRVETKVFYNDVRVVEGAEINYSLFLMTGTK